MNGYIVEIDELQDDLVVLVVAPLRLLVFGRTMDEALTRARASVSFRLLETRPRPEPAIILRVDESETAIGRTRRDPRPSLSRSACSAAAYGASCG